MQLFPCSFLACLVTSSSARSLLPGRNAIGYASVAAGEERSTAVCCVCVRERYEKMLF